MIQLRASAARPKQRDATAKDDFLKHRARPVQEGSETGMPKDLRRDQGVRFVSCRELVSAATAETAAMQAEFLRRRKQAVGPVEWHFVQPRLTLFWFRDNFKRLKARMDGRGVDVPLAGNSNLCLIPEGVEFKGDFDVGVGEINSCTGIFMIRDRIPEEYRSLLTEPVIGFRHDALARGLAEFSKELSVQDNVFPLLADGWMLQALAHMVRVTNSRKPISAGRNGGLAPWQLRRAMDFMRAHLSGNISLEQLASICYPSAILRAVSKAARACRPIAGYSKCASRRPRTSSSIRKRR